MLIKVFPRATVSAIKIFSRDSQECAYNLTVRTAREILFLSPERLVVITTVKKKVDYWLVSFSSVVFLSLLGILLIQ